MFPTNQQTNRERQLMLPGVGADLVIVRFCEEGFRRDPGIKKPSRGEYDFTSADKILKTMADD